jgi:hypothetical protein
LAVNFWSVTYFGNSVVCNILPAAHATVNREILVMVLFWPILAPKYEVPKLNTALVLIIAFTGKWSVHVFVYTTIIHNKQIKGYMTDHIFIIGFCTCKSFCLTSFLSKTLSITVNQIYSINKMSNIIEMTITYRKKKNQ